MVKKLDEQNALTGVSRSASIRAALSLAAVKIKTVPPSSSELDSPPVLKYVGRKATICKHGSLSSLCKFSDCR